MYDDGVLHFELANAVVIEVQLLDLFEVLEELNLGEFVVVEFEDLDLLEYAELEAMQLLEDVVGEVQYLEALATIQTLLLVEVGGVVKRLDLVLTEDEYLEVR